jgi:hypothetical protein
MSIITIFPSNTILEYYSTLGWKVGKKLEKTAGVFTLAEIMVSLRKLPAYD